MGDSREMKKRNIIISLLVFFAISVFCFAGCATRTNDKGKTDPIYDPDAAPSLAFGDLTLETGDVYEGRVTVYYGDKEYDNTKVNFVWTLADGAAEGICSVAGGKNGAVTVTATAEGETEYTVSATVNGKYVNKAVKMTVVERRIALIPEGNVTAEKGGYSVTLCTADYDGLKTAEDLTFVATDGVTDYGEVEISWDEDDNDYDEFVASFEKKDGKIYTFKTEGVGETILTGTYTAADGRTAGVKLYIRVLKAVMNLDYRPVIDIEHGIELDLPEEVKDAVVSVTYNGVNVLKSCDGGKVTLEASSFPKGSKYLGDGKDLVISTANYDYAVKADVYTMVIKTKADMDAWGNIARTNGNFDSTAALDGYFALGANIEYNGEYVSPTDCDEVYTLNRNVIKDNTWQNTARFGFKGVFDGKGYNVDGMAVKGRSKKSDGGTASGGFVGYMNNDGVVKNISFTNAGLHENSGFITSFGGGLIENVSIQFKFLGIGKETQDAGGQLPRAMGAFYPYTDNGNGRVVDCFVDAIGAEIHPSAVAKKVLHIGTNTKNVENLVVLTDNAYAAQTSGSSLTASSYKQMVDEFSSAIANFGEEWEKTNGVPFLKNYYNALCANTAAIQLSGAPEKLYGGMSATLTLSHKYAGLTADDSPVGITINGNTIRVTDEAESGTITVRAKSYLDGSEATASVRIIKAEEAPVTSDVIFAEAKADAEVDLAFAADYLAAAVKVRQGSTETDGITVTNNKIKLDLSAYAEKSTAITFTIFSEIDGTLYYVDVEVQPFNYVSDGEGLFNTFASGTVKGYYVLKNDVTVTTAFTAKRATLEGVLDGNGYAVKGVTGQKWDKAGFIQEIASGATLKNIAFTEVNLSGSNSIVASNQGTIENVYVQYSNMDCDGQRYMATFGSVYQTNNGTIRNVTVDFNGKIKNNPNTERDKICLFASVADASQIANAVVYGVPEKYADYVTNQSKSVYIVLTDGTTNGTAVPTAGWDGDCWITKSEGSVPFFKGYTAPSAKGFAEKVTEIELGSSATFTPLALNVITLGDDAVGLGVMFENGVVTVPDNGVSVGATFKIYARNIFDYANAEEVTVTVAQPLERVDLDTTATIDLNASVSNGTIAAADKNVEIDLRSVYTGSATDVPLTIGNVSVQTGEIADGILTLNAKNIPVTVYGNGTLSIKIASAGKLINAPVFVVTKTIGTLDELRVLKDYTDSETMQGGGYYRLGANIKVGNWFTGKTGSSVDADYRFGVKYGFKGTLDGAGYALDAVGVAKVGSSSGFIDTLNGGTIKNISFTDLALSTGCGLTYTGTGTLENVYVKYSKAGPASYAALTNIVSGGWAGYYTSTFFSKDNAPAVVTMTNVVVDLSATHDTAAGFWENPDVKVRALFGNIDKASDLKNVAVIGANKAKEGSKTASDSSGLRFNIVCDAAWSWNNGAKAGIYVNYSDDGSTNGVAFPANNWNTNFWTVDAAAGTITWKTK